MQRYSHLDCHTHATSPPCWKTTELHRLPVHCRRLRSLRHCTVLRADFREGDEDSNFSLFRVRRFTESPGPLHWIAFPVEILTKPPIHWIACPLFTEKPFFFTEKCFVASPSQKSAQMSSRSPRKCRYPLFAYLPTPMFNNSSPQEHCILVSLNFGSSSAQHKASQPAPLHTL